MPFSGAPLLPYLIYCRSFLLPFAPGCSLHPAVSAPSSALCGKTGVHCGKALESCGFFSRLISSSLGAACPSFPRSHPHYLQYAYLYIYYLVLGKYIANAHQIHTLFAKGIPFCEQDAKQIRTRYAHGGFQIAGYQIL